MFFVKMMIHCVNSHTFTNSNPTILIMKKFFKTGILLMAISVSLVACRDAEAADDVDDLEQAEIISGENNSKVKIKTDDTKIKVKTDDDGNVKKKVKIDNE